MHNWLQLIVTSDVVKRIVCGRLDCTVVRFAFIETHRSMLTNNCVRSIDFTG